MKILKHACILLLLPTVFWTQIIPPRAGNRSAASSSVRVPRSIGRPVQIPAPLGLPPVPIPEDNPPTEEAIQLGRKLFFDKILSRDRTVACASCHDPAAGFSDPRPVSIGVSGARGSRNAMSILNAAYDEAQFWDGRARTLEDQAHGPIPNPAEFAHSTIGVERRLAADPAYGKLFERAFGPGRITYEMAAKAIASYERTLLSGNSAFDRYMYGGDKSALSPAAIRGLQQFSRITLDSPNCISCHRIESRYAKFTDHRFHNTGVAWDQKGNYTDEGHSRVSNAAKDRGAFKVPTLRNIALTAPYMHNGSLKTLEEVIDFYFKGGRPNPLLSGVMPHAGVNEIPLAEQPQAKADLVEFLKSLTGELPAGAVPPEVKRP